MSTCSDLKTRHAMTSWINLSNEWFNEWVNLEASSGWWPEENIPGTETFL